MVVRRFHYTVRKRILHVDAKVAMCRLDEGGMAFDIRLDLLSYGLPGDALVFVEAYRQTSWMRFPYGCVSSIQPPSERSLDEFESPESVLFRVKVTSSLEPDGLLLAEADKIRPRQPDEEESDSIPLLPVKPDSSLGDQVYLLSIEDQPRLLINDRIDDWQSLARDSAFGALVFPSILREVLVRILHVEKYFEVDDHSDWKSQWLLFSITLPGVTSLPVKGEDDSVDDWIDEVVSSFCRRRMSFKAFTTSWIKEGVS